MRNPLRSLLAALPVLLGLLHPDAAEASPSEPKSSVLIMLVEQQSKQDPAASEIKVEPLPEVRNSLASYVRDTFGNGSAPSLSKEESQCADLPCQRRLAASYGAGYVLNIGIRQNFEKGVACTITLIGIGFTSDTEYRSARSSRTLKDRCTPADIEPVLHKLADEALHDQLKVPYYAPRPPACRAPYFNKWRAIGLGAGSGLALAGLAWSAGAAATSISLTNPPPGTDLAPDLGNRSALIGGGVGTLLSGVVIGGAAMLPFERWVRGRDPEGCVVPPAGKWTFGRTALLSFLTTSLAASLASSAVLGSLDGQVCATSSADPSRTGRCSTRPFWGTSLGFAGLYAIGLGVTVAIP